MLAVLFRSKVSNLSAQLSFHELRRAIRIWLEEIFVADVQHNMGRHSYILLIRGVKTDHIIVLAASGGTVAG